jgi:hypothetical protein
MLLEAKSTNDPLKKAKLINNMEDITDKVVQNIDLEDGDNMVFGDKMYSGQIYTSDDLSLSRDMAIMNNLPLYNVTECEAILREVYGLTANDTIIYVTGAIDGLYNDKNSTSYKISAYDGKSKKKLDLDNCENAQNSVEIPLSDTSGINMTLYNEMKEQGIDIFNPNDNFYNDRCVSYAANDTDITIKNRRNILSAQKVPECVGLNCTYQGIGEYNYLKCQCAGLGSSSTIVNQITDMLFDSLSQINVGIVTCYKQILTVYFI